MWFIEVLIGDATYHKAEALTYSSDTRLEVGRIVSVPLRQKQVLGMVVATVPKPSFAAKPIIGAPDLAPLPKALLDLLEWMRIHYPAPLGQTVQLFLPSSIPKDAAAAPRNLAQPSTDTLPPLTDDQSSVLGQITRPGMHLLHGETGTGKTRVYIELARRNLEANRSSLILTPEIGLSSQLAQSFQAVFGNRVIVIHSGLKATERRTSWQEILNQPEPVIIVGARSALFSPVKNLGLIVVDESHEPAYKQDQTPYYHATTVAAKLAGLHGSTLVLGSATPLVTDYYVATAKERPVLNMTQVATDTTPTKITTELVDLKDRQAFTKSGYLSDVLLGAIRDSLEREEQVLLFLNRRGTARVIFCEQCSWQAMCPHCDLPLTYHGDQHLMRCHSCSYKAVSPTNCPECHNPSIVFKSIGTKAIADEVKRLFKGARVMRFDTDNKKTERLEANYDQVRSGGVDIIVGTQTLAKGLDLPNLGLVGVVLVDTSLYFPDFSTTERTFQLLTQVLGRVGRGHRQGAAVIQTYNPQSPLLQAVLDKDWLSFYKNELTERQQFLFPPFCYLLKLSCARATSASAQKASEQFADKLRKLKRPIIIEGPAPSFHEKSSGKFVWQLVIKAKQRGELVSVVQQLPPGWTHDIDPMNLL